MCGTTADMGSSFQSLEPPPRQGKEIPMSVKVVLYFTGASESYREQAKLPGPEFLPKPGECQGYF